MDTFPKTEFDPSTFEIPENELEETASRSGGQGGQNVNKVNTRITLTWDFERSSVLSEDQKSAVREKLASRLNRRGELAVTCSEERFQWGNRKRAREILDTLVRGALAPEKPRVATKVSDVAQQRRVGDKRVHGNQKAARGRRWGAEE